MHAVEEREGKMENTEKYGGKKDPDVLLVITSVSLCLADEFTSSSTFPRSSSTSLSPLCFVFVQNLISPSLFRFHFPS